MIGIILLGYLYIIFYPAYWQIRNEMKKKTDLEELSDYERVWG